MSCTCSDVQLNDIGTQFKVTFEDCDDVVDIGGATTIQFTFKKPSGDTLTVSGTLYTDGTDGIAYYNSVSGDLNEVGTWKLQGFIIIGVGEWHSDTYTFKVKRNL